MRDGRTHKQKHTNRLTERQTYQQTNGQILYIQKAKLIRQRERIQTDRHTYGTDRRADIQTDKTEKTDKPRQTIQNQHRR